MMERRSREVVKREARSASVERSQSRSRGRDRSRDRPAGDRLADKRVYISNIPYDSRCQDIKDLMRKEVGEVAFVELFNDETEKPRGCGIIEFENPASAKKAIDKMHRFELGGRKIVVKEDYDVERDKFGRIVTGGQGGGGRKDDGRGGGRERSRERDRGIMDNRGEWGNAVGNSGNWKFGNSYGLSGQFLESRGIEGPLISRVFVSNLDFRVDEKKLKEVFRLAGRVLDVELNKDKDGKSRGHCVIEYEHPVEAVQAISMLNNQQLFERRMHVKMDRLADPLADLAKNKLPEGLKGIGMGLGLNGQPLVDVAISIAKNASNSVPNGTGGSASAALQTPLVTAMNMNPAMNNLASLMQANQSAMPSPMDIIGQMGSLNAAAGMGEKRRDLLFKKTGKTYTQEEFDKLCFEFGVEMDDVDMDPNNIEYEIDIPTNRYDVLCVGGIATALADFINKKTAPKFTKTLPSKPITTTVSGSTSPLRPYVVTGVLRNMKITPEVYDSLIDLQEKLHHNICRKRTLVTIGVHDLDTLTPPFTYSCEPPKDIKFKPLNQTQEFVADELMEFYQKDTHLKPYLYIIKDEPRYPVIRDSKGIVLSLHPIINGDHSKVTTSSKNIFIECTATDLKKGQVVLDTIVTMLSEHLTKPYEAEATHVFYEDTKEIKVYPSLEYKLEAVDVELAKKTVGIKISAEEMGALNAATNQFANVNTLDASPTVGGIDYNNYLVFLNNFSPMPIPRLRTKFLESVLKLFKEINVTWNEKKKLMIILEKVSKQEKFPPRPQYSRVDQIPKEIYDDVCLKLNHSHSQLRINFLEKLFVDARVRGAGMFTAMRNRLTNALCALHPDVRAIKQVRRVLNHSKISKKFATMELSRGNYFKVPEAAKLEFAIKEMDKMGITSIDRELLELFEADIKSSQAPFTSEMLTRDMPAPEQNCQVAKNVSPDNHEYKLFYPNMKGLAEPVRMLFKAAGQDFEDIRVTHQQWKSMNSKYEYKHLPVLEIDGHQLANPNAIMRYMSKKFQMAGKDDFESYKIDELGDELIYIRSEFRKFFMEKDHEEKKALKMILEEETVPKYFGRLEELKKVNGGKFFVGEKLSWVDIQYANSFELFEAMLPGIMDAYPRLKLLQQDVLEIPEIKEWIRIRPATQL